MILDSILVAMAVAGALAILVRHYAPRPRPKGDCASACGACPARSR